MMLNRVNLNLSTRRCKFILINIHYPSAIVSLLPIWYNIYFNILCCLSSMYYMYATMAFGNNSLAVGSQCCSLSFTRQGTKVWKAICERENKHHCFEKLVRHFVQCQLLLHIYHRKWMKQYRATTVNVIVKQYI